MLSQIAKRGLIRGRFFATKAGQKALSFGLPNIRRFLGVADVTRTA